MSDKFILYYHKKESRLLAEFLSQHSNLLDFKPAIASLPNTNSSKKIATLSKSIRDLLFFGRPDVLLSYNNGIEPEKVVFAWEISVAKPATDHWMQRFPSLVGACELGIPSVFIMRYESDTESWHGKLESEFFYTYDRVMEIHQIPIYLADWLPDDSGNLNEDVDFPGVPHRNSEPMNDTINFLNKTIDYAIHGKDFKNLIKERIIVELRNKHRVKIEQIPNPQNYNRLTTINKNAYLSWKDVESFVNSKKLKFPFIPPRVKLRTKSLVFKPRLSTKRKLKETLMNRIIKRNGNPYNGMPLAFDFMFCRLGKSIYERDVNLIIDLTELNFNEFSEFARKIHNNSPIGKSSIPQRDDVPVFTLHLTDGYTYEIKDFIRQYCYAADLIILKDIVLPFI